jgi:hypothetical protein
MRPLLLFLSLLLLLSSSSSSSSYTVFPERIAAVDALRRKRLACSTINVFCAGNL